MTPTWPRPSAPSRGQDRPSGGPRLPDITKGPISFFVGEQLWAKSTSGAIWLCSMLNSTHTLQSSSCFPNTRHGCNSWFLTRNSCVVGHPSRSGISATPLYHLLFPTSYTMVCSCAVFRAAGAAVDVINSGATVVQHSLALCSSNTPTFHFGAGAEAEDQGQEPLPGLAARRQACWMPSEIFCACCKGEMSRLEERFL